MFNFTDLKTKFRAAIFPYTVKLEQEASLLKDALEEAEADRDLAIHQNNYLYETYAESLQNSANISPTARAELDI